MSALQQAIADLRARAYGQDPYLTAGRAIGSVKMPAARSKDDFKDALVASLAQSVISGGLAGYGQARAESKIEQAQPQLNDILAQAIRGERIESEGYDPLLGDVITAATAEQAQQEMAQQEMLRQLESKQQAEIDKEQRGLGVFEEQQKLKKKYGTTGGVNIKMPEDRRVLSSIAEDVAAVEEQVRKYDQTIDLMERIQAESPEDLTVGGVGNAILRYVKADIIGESEAQEVKAMMEGLISDEIKRISGAAASEPEAQRLRTQLEGGGWVKRIPNMITNIRRKQYDAASSANTIKEMKLQAVREGKIETPLIEAVLSGRSEPSIELRPDEKQYLDMGYTIDEIIASR